MSSVNQRPFIRNNLVTLVAIALFQLTTGVAMAFAPEGFENLSLLNRGLPTGGLVTAASYSNPIWTSDYESLEVIGNVPLGFNLLTFGGKATVANKFGDRTAYFTRFDLGIGQDSSFSVKWAHEDWKYISASKDALGAEGNFVWRLSDFGDGFYCVFGANYRYIKQRWDSPWWAPLNTNTKDREWYFTGVAGFKIMLDDISFYTIDANIRDAFSYYPLDNVAFDGKLYLGNGRGSFFNIFGGVRTSAIWVGTIYPSNYYAGIGLTVY